MDNLSVAQKAGSIPNGSSHAGATVQWGGAQSYGDTKKRNDRHKSKKTRRIPLVGRTRGHKL